MLMQSANMRCNAFQMANGIFLHTANTPETVCDLLSRLGISMSTQTINSSVKTLSNAANVAMQNLGYTFLTAYAYDNLDIEFKHSTPTIEKSGANLAHLTSATLIPLHPDVELQDVNCADEVWRRSPYNRGGDHSRNNVPLIKLMRIHEETGNLAADDLTRRQRFNKWKFLHDLIHHGPESFKKHRFKLSPPETVDLIPLQEKTSQVPLRVMEISPSTPASNAQVLENMFKQTSVGDPTENEMAKDIKNHATLVFGDLLTGERIRSLLESRSEESTPWRRFQGVVYVMGLFHFKMACADAIHKIFIQPKDSWKDPTSFMEFAGRIRPKETGKLKNGPAFRPLHELIQHIGIVSRLDCWLELVKKKIGASIGSLEEFSQKNPTWEQLEDLATILAKEFVASGDNGRDSERGSQESTFRRDAQFENALRREQIFLLYEEITYAMNYGDIGRLETCFMPWAFIFQGCGKHKYAAELVRYLTSVHFIYPEGLK
jgi:hypothetical protein